MRVLICNKHGGFGLSRAALHRLRELGCQAAIDEVDIGEPYSDGTIRSEFLGASFSLRDLDRHDPLLLQVFDEMGQEASGRFCMLDAIEIPDGVEYQIEEYDGLEWVAEKHRTWS